MGALEGSTYYAVPKTWFHMISVNTRNLFQRACSDFLSEISADLEEMGGENYDYIGEDSSSEPGNPPETRFDEEEPV